MSPRRGEAGTRVDAESGEERRLLGERLRMLRVRRRLSLGDVALGTGLSRSFLALLESGESDVSVSRLLRVAAFYGVWLTDLVGSVAPSVEITRLRDAPALPVDDPGHLRLLASQTVRGVLPFRIELPSGARFDGGMAHAGEEFIHCVSGRVELDVLGTIHALEEGDTASFPGRLPHSYHNPGRDPAVLVGATARGV